MTIDEMTLMNSATLMWKILNLRKPLKIAEKIDLERQRMWINNTEPRIKFTEHNFTVRASRDWNLMPEYIRTNNKLTSFKKQVKRWIIERRMLVLT